MRSSKRPGSSAGPTGWGTSRCESSANALGCEPSPSYSYFESKHDIYDAMFMDGNNAFIESMQTIADTTDIEGDPHTAVGAVTRTYFRFCTSDPVRYQLLFQRTIPDFVPSDASYAAAQRAYDIAFSPLRTLAITESDLDLVTGVMSGLVAQQVSNEPGGHRWERLIDRAVSMLLNELSTTPASHIARSNT